ncbi:MAG: hypothetical protein NTV34_02925 [Proteobacteria bacterium]|nr:hypothetical protein [Pseudomonadota bacterium]
MVSENSWAVYSGSLRIIELAHEDNYFSPGEAGWQSAIRVSRSSDPTSIGTSLSLDQGIGSSVAVGGSASKTSGIPDEETGRKGYDSTRYSGRFSFWMRRNTLRVGFEGSSQKTAKEPRDILDTDGRRLLIAENAKGSTATLRLTHLTTPTTILMGNFSRTTASGRPSAISYGGEIRQYLTLFQGAVHFALDSYADRGDLDTTTDYGKVSANTKTLRYYQRLPGDFIVSSVTRLHQEKEVPRSLDSDTSSRSHTSEVLAFKWRYVEGAWTDEATEVGLFGGYFSRSEKNDSDTKGDFVRMLGLQLKLVI